MSDAKALRLRCHGERQNQQARGVAPPVARPRCTRSHASHLSVVCVMVTGSVVSTSLAAKTLRRRWSLWVSVSARELTSTTRCSPLCSPLGRFRAHSRHTRPADQFAAARRPVGGRCIATLKPELTVSATLTLPIAGARRRNLLSDCAIECQLFTVSNLPRRTTSPQITHRPRHDRIAPAWMTAACRCGASPCGTTMPLQDDLGS